MLKLRKIIKDYDTGDTHVRALNGISLDFRRSEFVSILGPSGCGKTTLLNIIGGLDQYTSGDLIIDGVSTKKYKDADWDTYRNHSIGFVFQTLSTSPSLCVYAPGHGFTPRTRQSTSRADFVHSISPSVFSSIG